MRQYVQMINSHKNNIDPLEIPDQSNLSTKRLKDSFTKDIASADSLLLKASQDFGVIRNSGRQGSRYAPSALENHLRKMALHAPNSLWSSGIVSEQKDLAEVGSDVNESIVQKIFNNDYFLKLQNLESDRIKNLLAKFQGKQIIHLGGGHDHIYPLYTSLRQHFNKPLKIINIDPHLDTRVEEANSGTGFRQIDSYEQGQSILLQVGIKDQSNIVKNFTPLKHFKMPIITMDEINNFTDKKSMIKKVESLLELNKDDIVILSIDLDALSDIYAVSSPAGRGVQTEDLFKILSWYKSRSQAIKVYGLYEFNPIFEKLDMFNMKLVTDLIYKMMS